MTDHSYPQHEIGTVRGIEHEYQVHWLDLDLASLTLDGDEQITFCSANAGGFVSTEDVVDQAEDIVADWDAEDI